MKNFMLILALVCAFALPAQAATRAEQRAQIQRTKIETLNKLFKLVPVAKEQLATAAGYATFSSADVAAIFVSGTYGHGIAHSNIDGGEAYMQMASLGIGLGAGLKDFRTVFIFDTQKALNDFVTVGLDMSGHVDVAVKGGGAGGAITAAQDVIPGVRVYQMTENGLLAQVMLKGTKYWADRDLNEFDRTSDMRSFKLNQ